MLLMGPEHKGAFENWKKEMLHSAPIGPRVLEMLFGKVEDLLNLLPSSDTVALLLTVLDPTKLAKSIGHNEDAFIFMKGRTIAELNMRVPPRARVTPPPEPEPPRSPDENEDRPRPRRQRPG